MTYSQAKRLLSIDIKKLTIDNVYQHRGNLTKLYYILKGDQGLKTQIENGFVVRLIADNANINDETGWTMKDIFMLQNCIDCMDVTDKRIKELEM